MGRPQTETGDRPRTADHLQFPLVDLSGRDPNTWLPLLAQMERAGHMERSEDRNRKAYHRPNRQRQNQTRLTADEIDALVASYEAGETTVSRHLNARGVRTQG